MSDANLEKVLQEARALPPDDLRQLREKVDECAPRIARGAP